MWSELGNMSVEISIDRELLVVAALEATKAWVEVERSHVAKFNEKDGLSLEDFNSFLNDWMVARNSDKERRPELLRYINKFSFDTALEVQNVAAHAACSEYSAKIKKTGKNIVPTSMISKIAFCKSPTKFTPIDRLSVMGMKTVFPAVKKSIFQVHLYDEYYQYFLLLTKSVEDAMSGADWRNKTFSYGNEEIDNEYFSRRVADKYLMILGQGQVQTTRKKLIATKRTFSESAYALLNSENI